MKFLLTSILMTFSMAHATTMDNSYFQSAILSLKSNYGLICNESSIRSLYCHIPDSKLIGVNISLKEKHNDKIVISLKANRKSRTQFTRIDKLSADIQSSSWGKSLADSVVEEVQSVSQSDCEQLHEHITGGNGDISYVRTPGGHTVMRANCVNGKSRRLKVRADFGRTNNDERFLEEIIISLIKRK